VPAYEPVYQLSPEPDFSPELVNESESAPIEAYEPEPEMPQAYVDPSTQAPWYGATSPSYEPAYGRGSLWRQSWTRRPRCLRKVEEIPLPTVAGRVLVTIAPVPDFDRLLNLDGALGRMHGIANVSLADYAKEEVTFRLEVESPMTADDFAPKLSESAGSSASVATAEEGKLALRLAS